MTAFTAILPADKPQYQLLVMLDEPQSLKETYGFITSGWNAVPTGGAVIARIAPLLGIEPRLDPPAVRPPYSCGIEDNPVRRIARRPDWKVMRLRDLFSDDAMIEPRAEATVVAGLAVDSRAVKPGDLFFALAGHKTDGARFVEAAIAAGAVAV